MYSWYENTFRTEGYINNIVCDKLNKDHHIKNFRYNPFQETTWRRSLNTSSVKNFGVIGCYESVHFQKPLPRRPNCGWSGSGFCPGIPCTSLPNAQRPRGFSSSLADVFCRHHLLNVKGFNCPKKAIIANFKFSTDLPVTFSAWLSQFHVFGLLLPMCIRHSPLQGDCEFQQHYLLN